MSEHLHAVQRRGTSVERVLRPTNVAEALAALQANAGARAVAGGTDLLLDLERGAMGPPVTLVDLTGIDGFRSIDHEDDRVVLGGGATHNQVIGDARFRAHCLPVAQACLEIGSPQLRNRATLAGNLATASPANDSISALMAMGANVRIAGLADGSVVERTVPVAQFFTGFRQTVLAPAELISAIEIPRLTLSQRGLWVKLGLRRAQAISVVHAGVVVDLDGLTIRSARVALGSVAPTVVLLDDVTDALVGKTLDDETIRAAGSSVAAAINPIDDGRATAEYRRHTVATLIERSLRTLAADQQASMWPLDPPTLDPKPKETAVSLGVVTDDTMMAATLNGHDVSAVGAASKTLLDWIRDHAGRALAGDGLDGVKEGCAEGECGACTVRLDGAAVMSCIVPAAQASGAVVTTVEGLAANGKLHAIQQAFLDDFAVQCGFCTPGFLVAAAALLDEVPKPTDDQIRLALSGNLCRCTGYYPIIEAVHTAASQPQSPPS